MRLREREHQITYTIAIVAVAAIAVVVIVVDGIGILPGQGWQRRASPDGGVFLRREVVAVVAWRSRCSYVQSLLTWCITAYHSASQCEIV
jgi:hypothetical protein